MKEWVTPEVKELSIKKTELYDAGGANDGGFIANPSGKSTHQQVPGHVGVWKS